MHNCLLLLAFLVTPHSRAGSSAARLTGIVQHTQPQIGVLAHSILSLWGTSPIILLASLAPVQAFSGFQAAFQLLPKAFSLRSGRRASHSGAVSPAELRSLGDLSWLTGLLLLGTDCSATLSRDWAAAVQQVRAATTSLQEHRANLPVQTDDIGGGMLS